MTSTDPRVQALFTQGRMALIAVGSGMAVLGFHNSAAYQWVMGISGIVLVVGPAIWDFIATVAALFHAQAVGVNAGINLTVSGKAVDHAGNVISKFSPDAETPPRPPTVESAKEIVKEFASPVAPSTT